MMPSVSLGNYMKSDNPTLPAQYFRFAVRYRLMDALVKLRDAR